MTELRNMSKCRILRNNYVNRSPWWRSGLSGSASKASIIRESMIYQMLASATIKAIDLAVGVANRSIDLDTIISTAGSSTSTGYIANIVSAVRPSNVSDADREINSQSDSDRTEFVITQQKTQEGDLFLAVVTSGGSYTTLSACMTELRKICSNVQGFAVKFSGSASQYFVVYGILKVTQTIDYQPLDEIATELKTDYVQINPASVPKP